MKITIGGESLDIPDKEIERLKEEYGEKEGTPQEYERYLYVDNRGDKCGDSWTGHEIDLCRLKMGNCFWGPDKAKAAEMHKLRLQAMANPWVPEEGQECWYWNFKEKEAEGYGWRADSIDLDNLFNGNCHKTKEAAQEYGKKYHEAFMYLTKKK